MRRKRPYAVPPTAKLFLPSDQALADVVSVDESMRSSMLES